MKNNIEKLKERLNKLESSLFEAQLNEHERINNMGFGYGMRHSKINFSTSKTDHIKEQIKGIKIQIESQPN